MTAESLHESSGLATFSKAIARALGLAKLRAIGLAMNGQSIHTCDEAFFDGFHSVVQSAERLLSALGYTLEAFPSQPQPPCKRLGIDPTAYASIRDSLPRAIPLLAVQEDQVRAAFASLALMRTKRYPDVTKISMTAVSEKVAAILLAPPEPFGHREVPSLSEAFPILIRAHTGLKASHIPLICGCRSNALPVLAHGRVHKGLERHVALYHHLGIGLRIVGRAGEISVRLRDSPIESALKRIQDYIDKTTLTSALRMRARQKAQRELARTVALRDGAQKRTGRKSRSAQTTSSHAAKAVPARTPDSKRAKRGKRMTAAAIIERLAAGDQPLELAAKAGVSHQYIYKIARAAGLARRKASVHIGYETLRSMSESTPVT